MHTFYQPDIRNEAVVLNEEESKHCVRVLRLKKGDEIHLADGKGKHAVAEITDDHPKRCLLHIKTSVTESQTSALHIAIAPTKNFDRMEWFIEKATEIGIAEISFVECHNSERNKINMERCEKVAVSAMKQSKQWWLPTIHDIVPLKTFLASPSGNETTKLIAWCEAAGDQNLRKYLNPSAFKHTLMLIGPEGDFTIEEIELARQAGFTPVSLGENILRTETAALYTCAAVSCYTANVVS